MISVKGGAWSDVVARSPRALDEETQFWYGTSPFGSKRCWWPSPLAEDARELAPAVPACVSSALASIRAAYLELNFGGDGGAGRSLPVLRRTVVSEGRGGSDKFPLRGPPCHTRNTIGNLQSALAEVLRRSSTVVRNGSLQSNSMAKGRTPTELFLTVCQPCCRKCQEDTGLAPTDGMVREADPGHYPAPRVQGVPLEAQELAGAEGNTS
ncbi:hypothetical protein K2173_011763 [Erythroxylum novogranatense]|uniref:Uncharacterized protein n=1 Tax=Erythroxylum novogranatense TaxID=1862640 RepID=A0AAV8TT86_9ROSI|nr:hypothetical protein K2173_011763 [Erythroxylum novogranatense]